MTSSCNGNKLFDGAKVANTYFYNRGQGGGVYTSSDRSYSGHEQNGQGRLSTFPLYAYLNAKGSITLYSIPREMKAKMRWNKYLAIQYNDRSFSFLFFFFFKKKKNY